MIARCFGFSAALTAAVLFALRADAQDSRPSGPIPTATPVATATLASVRTSMAKFEPLRVRLTLANDIGVTPITGLTRSALTGATTLLGAGMDRQGHWLATTASTNMEAITLLPGEAFTLVIEATLPTEFMAPGMPLSVQWIGSGPLKGVRSNELTVNLRDDSNPIATIDTSEGVIVIELLPAKAPNHVANFITLAESGFYRSRLFHRVIPNFMVQTGCPKGDGMGDPGYKVPDEFNDMPFAKGTVGMAHSGAPNSAGSQFFICVADTHSLDNKYTAFGRVLEGQEVADRISNVPREPQGARKDRPYKDVVLKNITIARPPAYVLPALKKAAS